VLTEIEINLNYLHLPTKIIPVKKSKTSGHRLQLAIISLMSLFYLHPNTSFGQQLKLNDLEYFEKQGVNILVFSDQSTGIFYDEKIAGI